MTTITMRQRKMHWLVPCNDKHSVVKKDGQEGMLNREKWKKRRMSKKMKSTKTILIQKNWNVSVYPYLTGSLSLNGDCCALRGSKLSKLQCKCFAPMGFTTSINRPKHSTGFTCDYRQVRAIITMLISFNSTWLHKKKKTQFFHFFKIFIFLFIFLSFPC